MKTLLALTLALLCTAWPAAAQTLRWAGQGDPLTMDPHSQNEGLTNNLNGQVYEALTRRRKDLSLEPWLATSWQQVNPTTWRFMLRPGVKFHDGTPMTADDVVFSVQRAQQTTANIAVYANALGTPVALDAQTVEFRLPRFNPVFLEHLTAVFVMSRAWCEKHRVVKPLDFKNREESFASFNANGTGPFMLVKRQPGIKTTYQRNPNWWGSFEGNVQAIEYTPISNDGTRLAALISGQIDFVLDPAPHDVPRLRTTPGVKVVQGPELRSVFVGMDQARDQLLYANVSGKNPFKDLRVRQALYHAIDIETLKTRLMNGLSQPTGSVLPSPRGSYDDPAFEARLPFDLKKARALMAEAGYPQGFEVTIDCPNNRYINDEKICIALAAMWAQIRLKVRVNAQPRNLWFERMEKRDTSLFLMGWGGAVTDAETTLTPVMKSIGDKGQGFYNWGGVRDPEFDRIADASAAETDPKKREVLVKEALRRYQAGVHLLPLHRQVIPWAMRSTVSVVHRADNWLEVPWVTLNTGVTK